jgi:hypothetical protein
MEPRFPDCYPRAPSVCKHVADPFFDCININSIKENPEDKDAGKRGLAKCLDQMEKYVACMNDFESKNPPHRYRVRSYSI